MDNIDGKMHGSVLEEKSSFKMIWLSFSSKLDWGYCIISIGKTVYKKIGVLTHSMKFLSCEVAFYFFSFFVNISHIILHNWHFRNLSQILCIFQLCMEYSCHDWAGPLVAHWNCWISTKTDKQDCWSFTCYLSWIRGSSLKFSKLTFFL